jgi:hypothetical protein
MISIFFDVILRQFLYNFSSNPADIIFKNRKFYLKNIEKINEDKLKDIKKELVEVNHNSEVTHKINTDQNESDSASEVSSKFVNKSDNLNDKLIKKNGMFGGVKVNYTQIDIAARPKVNNLC